MLTAAALLGAAFTARYYAARLEEADVIVRYGAGLIAVGLIWLLLSREVYDYCTLVLSNADERLAQAALSVTWTAYAALLLWIGFALRHALTRWAALVVFAVTVAKVFLYDLNGLDGLFRILAFLVLSLVLAAAAWGYQRFQAYQHRQRSRRPSGEPGCVGDRERKRPEFLASRECSDRSFASGTGVLASRERKRPEFGEPGV